MSAASTAADADDRKTSAGVCLIPRSLLTACRSTTALRARGFAKSARGCMETNGRREGDAPPVTHGRGESEGPLSRLRTHCFSRSRPAESS